jgi:uncharacterized protein
MDVEKLEALLSASAEKMQRMRSLIRAQGSALVAFSGGVDSSLVLAVALQELGDRAVALTAISPSIAPRERDAAQALARALGAEHLLVSSSEIDDPDYVKNATDRCYFCKNELYSLCNQVASERGISTVLDGFNADDAGDHRPGRVAGDEQGVLSPLLLAGLRKEEVRAWAWKLDLPTWEKPQLACLASRIPYGTPVTQNRLQQVGRAEEILQDLGLRIFRVRHHGEVARIEAGADELPRLLADAALRQAAVEQIRSLGFRFVALDLEPFRSGRMNEGVVDAPLLPILSQGTSR